MGERGREEERECMGEVRREGGRKGGRERDRGRKEKERMTLERLGESGL